MPPCSAAMAAQRYRQTLTAVRHGLPPWSQPLQDAFETTCRQGLPVAVLPPPDTAGHEQFVPPVPGTKILQPLLPRGLALIAAQPDA